MDEDFKVRHALTGYKSPEYDLGLDLEDSDEEPSIAKDSNNNKN